MYNDDYHDQLKSNYPHLIHYSEAASLRNITFVGFDCDWDIRGSCIGFFKKPFNWFYLKACISNYFTMLAKISKDDTET